MSYEVPQLEYGFDALAPSIDAKTMEIHHGKHHAAYVAKLNAAVDGTEWQDQPINELISNLQQLPDSIRAAVRNNGGGHANHSLFWEVMSPNGGGEPTGELLDKINTAFGDFSGFKTSFSEAAATRFGSGWAWLGVQSDHSLYVCSTPNQDNPLMTGVVDCPCIPILGLDVWEHAYYLNYQNRRPDYIDAFFNVINWDKVTHNYNQSIVQSTAEVAS